MPFLTTTNPLFRKTSLLKLNDRYKLQICKLMCNTLTGFDVEHNIFTLASSDLSHIQEFQKANFLTERPRTRLGLNCYKYLVHNSSLVFQKLI